MLEQGGFDGVDFALMIHPTCGGESRNYINRNGRASEVLPFPLQDSLPIPLHRQPASMP